MGLNLKGMDWKQVVFPERGGLPQDLTTADWLKTLAVVLMIIDHVGFYLFPDIEWFRVIGRAGMPVWFFLVGYARRQDMPTRWLYAGIILLAANLLVGLPPFALCALFTLALCRLIVAPLWAFVADRPVYMWWVVLLLVFLGPITDHAVEYGSFGLLFAMVGYAKRRDDEMVEAFGYNPAERIFVAVMLAFIVYQWAKFGFSLFGGMVMVAGFLGMSLVLQGFKNKTLAGTAQNAQAPLVRFAGRYTLEIYVIHLLVLKGVFALREVAEFLI